MRDNCRKGKENVYKEWIRRVKVGNLSSEMILKKTNFEQANRDEHHNINLSHSVVYAYHLKRKEYIREKKC